MVVALDYTFFQLCVNTEQISKIQKIQNKLCKSPYCRSNQNDTVFCLMRSVQSVHVSFFCSCLPTMIVPLRNVFLWSTPVARMLLTSRWVCRGIKMLSIRPSLHRPQQTFVGLEDVLKTSSTRLQRNNFTSSKTSCKDVLKTSCKTS